MRRKPSKRGYRSPRTRVTYRYLAVVSILQKIDDGEIIKKGDATMHIFSNIALVTGEAIQTSVNNNIDELTNYDMTTHYVQIKQWLPL